jgi:transcriptional regulator with XRE-family HTH domain
MTTIFDNLKSLAKERGMSIQSVMKQAGLGINAAYKWRPTTSNPNGVTPSRATLAQVARVLSVNIEALTKDTNVNVIRPYRQDHRTKQPFAFKFEELWYQLSFMPALDTIYVARYTDASRLVDQKLLSRPYFIQMADISSSPVYGAVFDYLFGPGSLLRYSQAFLERKQQQENESTLNINQLKDITDPLKYFLFVGDWQLQTIADDVLNIYDNSSESESKEKKQISSVYDFSATILKTMYLSTTPLIELDKLMSGQSNIEWRNFAIQTLSTAANVDYSKFITLSDEHLPSENFHKWLEATGITSTYFMAKGIPTDVENGNVIPSFNIPLPDNANAQTQKDVLTQEIKDFSLEILRLISRQDAVSPHDIQDALRLISDRHPNQNLFG